MVKVKICGVTNVEDALVAAEAGADAVGLNFVEGYPRCISWETAREISGRLPPFVTVVGVFADTDVNAIRTAVRLCGLRAVQLHGEEPSHDCHRLVESVDIPIRVIKAFRMRGPETLEQIPPYLRGGKVTPLLDAYHPTEIGGVGKTFQWELVTGAKDLPPFILSGGLNPGNVAEAVRAVHPYAVDVSSGVEAELCKKDPEKVRAFIQNARAASSA
ncbi:MAG: phosphoribosylanthranilate isomerase [Candidatus Tectomicrobia bacterium]|nr:phosphoribosylanthranilate isomerase [Candidatus Tectomicrobia bacterium]